MTRAIDALIGEHVMGLENVRFSSGEFCDDIGNGDLMDDYFSGYSDVVLKYSTNIADAWLVVEKLTSETFLAFDITFLTVWTISIVKKTGIILEEHKDFPMAICLAALKALGIEVPDEN